MLYNILYNLILDIYHKCSPKYHIVPIIVFNTLEERTLIYNS